VLICTCVVRSDSGRRANSPAGSAAWISGDPNAAASDEFARAVRRMGELLKEFDARGSHMKGGRPPFSRTGRRSGGPRCYTGSEMAIC
jgi:hypothetical protein